MDRESKLRVNLLSIYVYVCDYCEIYNKFIYVCMYICTQQIRRASGRLSVPVALGEEPENLEAYDGPIPELLLHNSPSSERYELNLG